jgi:hypothetical protein
MKKATITLVVTIPKEPTPPSQYSDFQKAAYRDGWNVAASKAPRHGRPSYLTHEERSAFDEGWDKRDSYKLISDVL